jgi:Tol biopolymer transport system component
MHLLRGAALAPALVMAATLWLLPAARGGGAGSAPPTGGVIAFDCVDCFASTNISTWPPTIRWNGRLVRVSGDVGQEARLSPDGRLVAYVWDGAIWLRTLEPSPARRLTNGPTHNGAVAGDDAPAWFPDGKRLAFIRNGALWTVGNDGRGAKRLYAAPASQRVGLSDPDVSPDGRRIAFDDSAGHLWVTGLRGLTAQRLGPAGLNGSDPRWSPDGTHVAFLYLGQQLAILDLRTNRVRDLGFGLYGAESYFSWSPDSRSIAASQEFDYDCGDPTGQCTTEELWIANATDGTARRIYRTQSTPASAASTGDRQLPWASVPE